MAKKKTPLDGLVLPSGKMTSDQLAHQLHLARRAGADVNLHRQARKGITKGGRGSSRRAAITAAL
jgi:hypothetical protein